MKVLSLGTVKHSTAFEKQLELVEKRIRGDIPDTLLLLEHPAVITLGRSSKKEHILNSNNVEVVEVNRGGDVTCHFPGQLVGYPILDLSKRGKDIHKYMRDIEEVLINFLKLYGVTGVRVSGKTGVYIDNTKSAQKDKIASIGVAARQWISYHGFAINIKKDISVFDSIIPCGLKGVKATSLEILLNKEIVFEEALERLGREFTRIFG